MKRVIAVLSDLMFTVKIQDAAKRAGLESVFVTSQEDAITRARENPVLMIFDLNYAAANPLELIRKLKHVYAPFLDTALRHRGKVLIIAVVITAPTLVLSASNKP